MDVKQYRREIEKLTADFAGENNIKNMQVDIELVTYTNVVNSCETLKVQTKLEIG